MSDHWYTSMDPTVIEALRNRDHDWETFRNLIHDAKTHYGIRFGHTRNPFTGDLDCVCTVGHSELLPGRWTKPGRDGASRPYQTNMEGRALLATLGFPHHPIPGLPDTTRIQNFEGIITRWIQPFLDAEGRAWTLIPEGDPQPDGRTVDTSLWAECEEWEYLRARNETESSGQRPTETTTPNDRKEKESWTS